MVGPLLDLSGPAVRRKIALAKRRGYVTSDELDEILPPDEFSVEQIEDVLTRLAEMGISVVASVEDVQDRYRYLAQELRSFATGQRGQGRELLESAAYALDIEADGSWSHYESDLWEPQEEQRFLVFDQQHGIQLAERDPSGNWVGHGGQRLVRVTHWRSLPLPPSASM